MECRLFADAECSSGSKGYLQAGGIRARVININTIKLIDADIIVKAAKETGVIVIAEKHSISGRLGSAAAEVGSENYTVPVF